MSAEFQTRVIAAALRVMNATDPDGLDTALEEFDTYVLGYADVLNKKEHTVNDARPIFSDTAGKIASDSIGMVLYTNQKQDNQTWARRGVVDSYYTDPRAGLVSIGVDQRDIIDVAVDHEILLLPNRAA